MNLPPATPSDDARPLRLAQRRLGARVWFEFGEESLRHGREDAGGLRTWTVEYAELALEREQCIEREPWWRAMGYAALLLGLWEVGADLLRVGSSAGSMWIPFGAACLVVSVLRTRAFTVVPTPRAEIRIFHGRGHDAIVAELDRRRSAQLRDRFDYLSPDESPEQQRHRVLWLQKQGSLDDHEVSARLLQIDLMAQTSPGASPERDAD